MNRFSRKSLKTDEFVDAATDFGTWLEEHWRQVATWAAAVVIVALVVVAFIWNSQRTRREAAELLAQAQQRYRQATQEGALDSQELNETLAMFQEVARRGGGSAVAEVARFYEGAALHRLGRLDDAIAAVETVASGRETPKTLVGTAQTLLATLYVEAGRADEAATLLREASEATDPAMDPAQALLQLGRLEMSRGNEQAARAAWQQLVSRHPQAFEAGEARRLLGG